MKVTFFSNFLNHHQLPFCIEMKKYLGDDFIFVATEPIPDSRLKLGYEDINTNNTFVLCSYLSKKSQSQAEMLADKSDIVIIGDAPDYFIKKRLKDNKITFRYMEREFKKGYIHILDPRVIKCMLNKHTRYRNKNLYMLCASAYTPIDLAIFFSYRNKMFKWGYFPKVNDYDIRKLINKKNDEKTNILWVGRLIKYKHPELMINIGKYLKKSNIKFEIKIIGIGEMFNYLKKEISANQLEDFVKLLGPMSPNRVRSYMEDANIFVFTSNFEEGWGAVLNEAMNSGCAVVACHAIGSVPFLVENKVNGYIYENGNIKELCDIVKKLCLSKDEQKQLGINAYNTLKKTWNPEKATCNFLKICSSIMEGNDLYMDEGPMSKANVIFQRNMYNKLKKPKEKVND